MGKWISEGRWGLQGTDWSVTEWVPNPHPMRQGKYEWVANVRDRKTAELIATAPELLAALEQIATLNTDPGSGSSEAYVIAMKEIAREVIAKAKGGE